MTEFAYSYNPDPIELIKTAKQLDKYDVIMFDCVGLPINQIKKIYQEADRYLVHASKPDNETHSEIGGVLILFYEDTKAFVRNLWTQAKLPEFDKMKFAFTMNIHCGPNAPITGGGVNVSLSSPIQRVAAVFYPNPNHVLLNITGNRSTDLTGERFMSFGKEIDRKCVGGDIFAEILNMYKYDSWKNVFIGGFQRPFLQEFNKMSPKKPTEKFRFTVHVGESNIRAIDAARMHCAVNDISCNFDLCPSPQEVTRILKEMVQDG